MAQVTKETLIEAMHTYPSNEKEIGFNSALIFILKRLIGAVDTDTDMLREAFKRMKLNGYDCISQPMIQSITNYAKTGSKLQAVKDLKDITGLGLKESKDVIDAYCEIVKENKN